ncbi:hypothetical protein SEA_EVAA_69 [Gordonia phage Evaa]|nr:hypothetical protein SEA_EVAA_69 [Gordonia phage Evaa]
MPASPSDHLLQFFAYDHLPEPLATVSSGFAELAHGLVETMESGPELTVALRKLLEAKDCAVRHAVATRFGKRD